MNAATPDLVHLRAAGVSLLLDVGGPGLPAVLHWGADLGGSMPTAELLDAAVPSSSLDRAVRQSLLPTPHEGWRGTPALEGARSGLDWSPALRLVAVERPDDGRVVFDSVDPQAGLRVRSDLALAPSGVLSVTHRLTNEGVGAYELLRLAAVLPLPAAAVELLDLTGRWCRERSPQSHPFAVHGTWLRSSRHGRTGHDATLLLVAGTRGFGNRHGEVWAAHLGWSGDHASWAERGADGTAALGVSELLAPGELRLEPGETYDTPTAYFAWSDKGLDGISDRMHELVRSRPTHPARPRPVVLNTWEAVYFDHRLDRLTELADVAASLGVERFVLDDGWFLGRRDDRAGLGDWVVDPQVWPHGLKPLVQHVRGLGMEFGLWVEPEMVNEDSELFRAHPDWLLHVPPGRPPTWRHQQVLDLARPEAWQHILGRLDALLSELDIGYLKWDHNRDLVQAGHDGRPGVHAQTLAVYRLLDELRRRHPGVEIESCSSGGARVDLGILARTDRVWASDTNDALERQAIQRWTQLLLPPELVGSHVGPPTAHTTGRTHALSFRGATALFGHFGIEWDVASASAEERAGLARLVATYKTHRALLHSGRVVHADHPDPAAAVHGVVSADGREALLAYVALATSATEVPGRVRLPGLDPDRTYRIEPVDCGGEPFTVQRHAPDWWTAGRATASGRWLGQVGLVVPVLGPEQALVLHLYDQGAP